MQLVRAGRRRKALMEESAASTAAMGGELHTYGDLKGCSAVLYRARGVPLGCNINQGFGVLQMRPAVGALWGKHQRFCTRALRRGDELAKVGKDLARNKLLTSASGFGQK